MSHKATHLLLRQFHFINLFVYLESLRHVRIKHQRRKRYEWDDDLERS